MSESAAQRKRPGGLPLPVRLWQMLLLTAALLAGLYLYMCYALRPEVFFALAQMVPLLGLLALPLLLVVELMRRYTSLLALAACLCGGLLLAWRAEALRPLADVSAYLLSGGWLLLGALSLPLILAISLRFRYSVQASRLFICLFLVVAGMGLFRIWHGAEIIPFLNAATRPLGPLPPLKMWRPFPWTGGDPAAFRLAAGLAVNLFFFVYFTVWQRFLRGHFSPSS